MPPDLFEVYRRLIIVEGTVRWMRWLWMTLGTALITAIISVLVTWLATTARGDDDLAKPWNAGLVSAGRAFPGSRVFEGEQHSTLQKFAREHAEYQARVQQQGHQRWEHRFHIIKKAMGDITPTEICAESWPWEKDFAPEMVGQSMFKAWKSSSGHWRVASRPSRYYGAAMARGENGIWYACIIVSY